MKESVLDYRDYADDIGLFENFVPENPLLSEKERISIVDSLLEELDLSDFTIPSLESLDFDRKRQVLRGVLNTLKPEGLSSKGKNDLDRLLQFELKEKTIYSQKDLINEKFQDLEGTKIGMYQGDTTTLKLDAIVNAANSQMLGCFQPLHSCIDNVIHSGAGVQLRDDCDVIMKKQEHAEPTGYAKITRAYNLPSRFIIHTVGPIVKGVPGNKEIQHLKDCYSRCLDLCASISEIRSIAFCCISTGVFGYPKEAAADIAIGTVKEWVKEHPGAMDLVLFNVFTDKDRGLYKSLMEE